jgi:hypothetical protein
MQYSSWKIRRISWERLASSLLLTSANHCTRAPIRPPILIVTFTPDFYNRLNFQRLIAYVSRSIHAPADSVCSGTLAAAHTRTRAHARTHYFLGIWNRDLRMPVSRLRAVFIGFVESLKVCTANETSNSVLRLSLMLVTLRASQTQHAPIVIYAHHFHLQRGKLHLLVFSFCLSILRLSFCLSREHRDRPPPSSLRLKLRALPFFPSFLPSFFPSFLLFLSF